jgi:F0F1-type ATP synthase delta subunit
MKPSIKQYALALLLALGGQSEKKQKEIIRKFLILLTKNRAWSRLEAVLKEVERLHLKETGLAKVHVETASPISEGLRKEIEKVFGKKISLSSKINPGLFAGIKIIVNDEIMVDASAKKQLDKIFQK